MWLINATQLLDKERVAADNETYTWRFYKEALDRIMGQLIIFNYYT